MACVAVLSLMRTMELEFLQPHPRPILQQKELIPPNKDLIQSLQGNLQSLIELFDENRMDGVEAIKILETRLRDVAFRVEDEIELQVVHLYDEEVVEEEGRDTHQGCSSMLCQIVHSTKRKKPKTCPSLTLCHILQQAIHDIDAIKEELVKVKEEYELFKHHHLQATKPAALCVLPTDDQVITKADSSHHDSGSKEIMVGKQDEFKIIMEMLIRHPSKQREVVSIKGMGGIGKTTLARRIYEDPSTSSYFDKRAWIVASQHHNKRQMLLGLVGSKDDADSRSDEDLALQLYQSLKCQRYLVVMDDVWSGEAWDVIKTCFPDDGNGSRVLLTTRLVEVANHICTKNDFSHQMQLLEQRESWKLFYEYACKSRGAEFETIGRPVVEKCKGLPLAIIVVAGIFFKLNTLDEWKNIANALISSSASTTLDDEECSRILSLSYNHLPYNLKACFLYLGVFPEDKEINANDLARLWAAEGLVKAFKNESFEAVASRYIKELTDRNLILVSKRSCCGRKIKAFRVHDLLHAFCVREAQNQSLLHVVHESGSNNSPEKGFRWVRIQLYGFDLSVLHSCSKTYRSLFYFARAFIWLDLENFNLWRVLYSSTDFYVTKKTRDLIHLRYLRAFGEKMVIDDILPFKTWNLQTLANMHYYAYQGRNILEFPQLHYIRCHGFNGASPKSVHQNLQTIISLKPSQCTKQYLSKIPYLKKVSIEFESNAWYGCTKKLVCLQQLESLHIYSTRWSDVSINIILINKNILLLENLRKLAFHHTRFEWKEIKVLSKLRRLEVLKLFNSVEGEKWELPEDVKFCKLVYLKISSTNLKHWEASAYNFPKLERLLLHDCYQLRDIPNNFAEITTLNLIELRGCLDCTVMSAKQIQAEQHDYGNENMAVIEEGTRQVVVSLYFDLLFNYIAFYFASSPLIFL